ncbi:MAG: hypothetical protein OXH28_06670 [bacterium]|nr:hypothetical protein [bacterium]
MPKKSIAAGERAALLLANGTMVCYRPECPRPLVVTRQGQLVTDFEIAHIRDELPPQDPSADIGWRYWPDDLAQEERNQFDNLILLCPPCHKLIDRGSPRDFSPELLHEWKRAAEGTAFDDLSSEIFEIVDLTARLANALGARPRLQFSLPALASEDGLSFASRSATLTGRTEEQSALSAFLSSEGVFSWWAIVGEAGVGKSRLALECCHGVPADWDVGFVRDADQDALLEFIPHRPTLLVVDYAAARADWLGKLLFSLTDRSTADWARLRVLLLERTAKAKWHEAATCQARHHDSLRIMSVRYAEPLELDGLPRDATRLLIAEVLSALSDPPSSTLIEDLVDRAFEIDPAGRPLFSLIAALEFADPQLVSGSRDAVLRGLISRRNAQTANDKPFATTVLELATTALGGIDVEGYPTLRANEVAPLVLPNLSDLPTADIDRTLGGMVPDILGEMWILDELGSAGAQASACKAALGTAWGYSPTRYAAFVDRAARDHPSHAQLLALINVDCERDPETWFEMVCSVIPHLRDPRSPRVARVLDLLQSRPPSHPRARALAEAGFSVANLWLAGGARLTAHKLYTRLIDAAPSGSDVRWQSYTNRGVIELDLGNRARAEADFFAVISSSDATDESRACCLNNRADLRMDDDDHLGAIADRSFVLQLRETSYNRRYIALVRRAKSLWALERYEDANEDVEAILSTADIAVEQKMAARLMRAEWAAGMGDRAKAEADLKQVIASRRNFPKVTEAATALANDLGMLDGSALVAPRTDRDESAAASIAEPERQAYFSRTRGPT